MSSSPIAYLNDRFLPQSEAQLTLHDAGFVIGVTVTDLCRTFCHRPFRFADHLVRFRASCDAARVPQRRSEAELTQLVEELIAHNAGLLPPNSDLALVLFATPGPIGYYLGEPGGPGDGPPTFGMHTFPLPFERYARFFTEGVRLVIPSSRCVSPDSVNPHIKQRSRMHWWLASHEVHRIDPNAAALLLDRNGCVTETAAANFLIVRDGTVLTPPRSSVLDGISLRVTEELCHELRIPFEEQTLTPADCRNADEAMIAGTTFCLAGVRAIDGVSLTWPGTIFERLLAGWNSRVGLNIYQQILGNL